MHREREREQRERERESEKRGRRVSKEHIYIHREGIREQNCG